MNKIYLLLSFVVLLALNANGQSQRTLLFEEFTQASCPPCEASNPLLHDIIEANVEKIVQIRYQTSWPGVDPMNADNPVEVQERVDYYGVSGVPSLHMDGSVPTQGTFPQLVTQNEVDAQYAVESPILVNVKHLLAGNLASANVNVTVTNEGTTDYAGGMLRVAFTEEAITWDAPPGSTSITVFEAVMKSFVTGTAGIEIPTIAAGDSWTMNWAEANIPFTIYDARTIGVVAFVQDDATQAIHNADYSEPLTLTGDYADIAIYEVNNTNDNLCDREYTPSLGVANIGPIAADSYAANFYVNGELMESIEVTEELGIGSLNTVEFSPVSLPEYTSIITYAVIPSSGSDQVVSGFISDFEYTPTGEIERDLLANNIPTQTLVINGEEIMAFPYGAYAGSQSSLRVNFYGWNPAVMRPTGDLVIGDKIAVGPSYKMTFDYSFTTYQGSADRMEVQISTDCGASFTTLWDKAGSELATAPEVNGAPFVPTPSQWRSEEIDLSIYEGQEVIIRYFFTSGWSDMLYLDNVNVAGLSDINDLTVDESITVFPNPASEQLRVNLTLNESETVNYTLINSLGQVAVQNSLGTAKTYNESIDVSSLESGTYLLNLQIGDRQVVQRVQIIH